MNAAAELRHWAIEAATNLICADGSSCSDPADCRRVAAHYVAEGNRLLGGDVIPVATVRLGKVSAFAVTDTGRIRVRTAGGGTDIIDGIEVLR